MDKQSHGFDIRIEEYDYIHSNTEEDWNGFINAINPQDGNIIFDGAGGYGEVTEKILEKNKNVDIYVADISEVQLNRLKQRNFLKENRIILGDIRDTKLPDNFFDTCAIKMGVHEVPQNEQQKIFSEMYRILKKGGKFVTWELALTEDNQKVFQDTIREKDRLSGLNLLVENRYFPRYDEMFSYFNNSGFVNVGDTYTKIYKIRPMLRLHELTSKERATNGLSEYELEKLGIQRAIQLADYIRKIIPNELKESLKFKDEGGVNVEFEVHKKVYVGYK